MDETGAIERLAFHTVRSIYGEISQEYSKEEARKVASWAHASESAKHIRAVLNLARSQAGIPVVPDELDRNDWLLNCSNGTVDLKTGQIRSHAREDLVTRICRVEFVPGAKAPTFEKFLNQIFHGQRDLIQFVQRGIGYALTGDTREQCLFILWGDGANGKSTLVNVLLEMLGGYALPTPSETLLAKQHDGVPNDLARLKGVRFVAATETEDGV